MPLLKNGCFIKDQWTQFVEGDLPDEGKIILSLDEYTAHKESLLKRNLSLGVRIPNDVDVFTLADDLERIDLVVLDFPKFTDGRAYSQARHLRSALGYKGGLRAIGNILADQLSFMASCGVDEFEVDDTISLDVCRSALADMSLSYQEDFTPSSGGPSTILAKRRQHRQQRS